MKSTRADSPWKGSQCDHGYGRLVTGERLPPRSHRGTVENSANHYTRAMWSKKHRLHNRSDCLLLVYYQQHHIKLKSYSMF